MKRLGQTVSSCPRSVRLLLLFVMPALLASLTHAQTAQQNSVAPTPASAKPQGPKMPDVQGTLIDRVVAIVNGDLVLDSDVDEERRFEEIQPFPNPGNTTGAYSRTRAIERLVNRDLILQQSKLQPDDTVSDADVDKELANLRKGLPECKQYHCETDAGWKNFLAAHGFTPELMRERWRQRMQVLSFIEERFRMGVRIQPADIKAYYEKTLVPEFARQNAAPPKLEAVSDRIQEVLLQQQVTNLLNDWLNSLRAQGSVVVLHPGTEAP